jgi:hypothetical protein
MPYNPAIWILRVSDDDVTIDAGFSIADDAGNFVYHEHWLIEMAKTHFIKLLGVHVAHFHFLQQTIFMHYPSYGRQ